MNKEQIKEKLSEIKDPELGIDIVALGLIRDINTKEEGGIKNANILMTLTSPFCPFADTLIGLVEDKLKKNGFEEVNVDITFEPPWEPSDELRAMLGV